MSEDRTPARRLRAGDQERDQLLSTLEQAYAAGRLDLEELTERQSRALQVRYTDEIAELVSDLPEGVDLAGAGAPVVPPRSSGPAVAEYGSSVSIMSGKEIVLPAGTRHMTDFAFWGGNDIDVTDAMGPGSVLTLELHAIMGGNNVWVPEGVRVIDESIAIMAGNEVKKGAMGDGSNGILVLKGFLFWGGSEVKLASKRKK